MHRIVYQKDPMEYDVPFEFKFATMDFFTTELTEITERRENDTLTGEIIGAAIEIHRSLGPGLHEAQLFSYLKMSDYHRGLLINFNVKMLKDGIRRMRN